MQRKEQATQGADGGDYRFLARLAWPYRGALLGLLLLMAAQSLAALATPWLAGRFSEALLLGKPVLDLLLVWFAVIACQAALAYFVAVRSQDTASQLIADTSTRVFDHLQSLPLQWHAGRRRGEVLSLLTDDVQRLGYFTTGTLAPVLPLLLTCVGAFVMMARIDLRIGVLVALLLPALIIALRIVGRRLRPLAQREIEAHARQSAIAEQNLLMLPIVKAFSGEPVELQRFSEQTQQLRRIQRQQARLQQMAGPVVRVVAAGAVLVLLWFSTRSVANGAMQASDLVTLLLYGLLLTQPLGQLASVYGQTQGARAAARRLVDLFAETPEPDEGDRVLAEVRGEIVFEHVAYAPPARPLLFASLDLHIRAGETVAITGPNGAGKSTLAHLLLRLIEPHAGRITLDGVDLRTLRLRNLRAHIGLVAQNVLLFNASIADNIAYGDPDATREEIERAAVAARAHGFIMELPEGYDTLVGDQGVRLSGGQRQRLSLARSLLHDPAVLILDEATAMFDPDGERDFIAECHEVLRARTVLLITHRPASLALADRVLRLESGGLVPVESASTSS